MDPSPNEPGGSGDRPLPAAFRGRARGRARGVVRTEEGGAEGQVVLRTSPPGRRLEPRMGDLSLQEVELTAEQERRYTEGNGNSNGNGNGNGANGDGRHPINLDRYDFVRTRENNDVVKYGVMGTPREYMTNFFRVNTGPGWKVYHYRVDFAPAVDETKVRRQIFRTLRRDDGGFGTSNFIFDGHSFWTTASLTAGIGAAPLTLRARRNNDTTDYEIKLKMVGEVEPNDPQFIQIYNVITRSCLQVLGLAPMGRNYFDPNAEVIIPNHGLKLWPGFVTTMRQHESGILYCVELTNKVIRLENVFSIMRKIRQNAGSNFKEAVLKEVVGSIVLTIYNNRTYRVDDVDFISNPQSTFMKNGSPITYAEYYRKYADTFPITSMQQPLLVSNPKPRDIRMGTTEPVKLIPELCQLTGLTDAMRANYPLMKELGNHLFQAPRAKLGSTVNFVRRLTSNERALSEFASWGIHLDTQPKQVTGRILPVETINFRSTRPNMPANIQVEKADFTKGLRGPGAMPVSVDLNCWVVIVQNRDLQGVENLIQTMQRVADALKFKIARPVEVMAIHNSNPEAFSQSVTSAKNKHHALQMVFVILPNNKIDCYSAVKKRCYLDYALPSQCFLGKNVVNRGLMSIATKVVVQMNAKLGGECWNITIPLKSLMIVGFDVHHGGASNSRAASVGAMVATTSANFCRYYSTVSFFNSREEMSSNMASDVGKCLKAWQKQNNGLLPDRVIFYRDGVGQGQLVHVYNSELESIKLKLQAEYSAIGRDEPKLSMIICTKRINTRLFMKTGPSACDNPEPGSCVDKEITLPERWEFFLIAQAVRQGTVSPTNYNVIWERNDLNGDKVQRLTYKLCHLYYNWSGGVAVPSVVQYAHKLAFLTGTALGRAGNEGLSHLLYYL